MFGELLPPCRSGTRVRHRGPRDATAVQRRRRPVADDGRRRENRAQQGTVWCRTDSGTRKNRAVEQPCQRTSGTTTRSWK